MGCPQRKSAGQGYLFLTICDNYATSLVYPLNPWLVRGCNKAKQPMTKTPHQSVVVAIEGFSSDSVQDSFCGQCYSTFARWICHCSTVV
jgi:hypothetical protein